MYENRVKQLYEDGKPSFGTYITLPAAASVEVAALAGMDFVRIDPYHIRFNNETLENMIRTAYSYGITPWVRVQNDPWVIMTTLDLGAQAVTIPNVGTAAEAQAAVEATFYPPKGDREMSRPLRFRNLSAPDYIEWANSEVILSCQIEGKDGIENYQEIINVDGIDVIQTGRGDLSLALGVPGEQFHPKVLATEDRIVTAALEAGKQVSLLHPITEDGIEKTKQWMDAGVRILTLDSDYGVILRDYSEVLSRVNPK